MQKYLPLSSQSFKADRLKAMYSYINDRYDMLIIGSDAVFNWNQTSFPTAFIPDYHFTIPVYTYAASVHGLKFYDENKDRLKKCGEVFESMRCVGVRDTCSENFVKLCSEEARVIHCCDPTFFIDKNDIFNKGIGVNEKVQKKYGFSLDSNYIVVMAPDNAMIKSIYEKYSGEYKFISVFKKSTYSDLYIEDLNPFEWAVVLKKATAVITSYFHGTLLSLIQGTPAVVLDYSGYCDNGYEGKLKDLMIRRLSLPELYFDKTEAVSFKENDAFYDMFNNLIKDKYKDTIAKAVENEKKTIDKFIEIIKTEETDR